MTQLLVELAQLKLTGSNVESVPSKKFSSGTVEVREMNSLSGAKIYFIELITQLLVELAQLKLTGSNVESVPSKNFRQ